MLAFAMSYSQMELVLDAPVTNAQFRVLMILANYADRDGNHARPGMQLLITRTGMPERSVQEALLGLKQKGLIVTTAYAKGGRGRATEYRLELQTPQPTAPLEPPESAPFPEQKGADSYVTPSTNGANSGTKGCEIRPERVRIPAVNGADSRTPTSQEPGIDTVREPGTPPAPLQGAVTDAWEYYRDHIQPRARLTEGAKRKIVLRLKTWTLEELHEAVDHFAADAWWMENNAHRGAEWFFATDGRIEQLRLLQPEARRNGNGQPKLYVNGSPLARRQLNHEEGRAIAAKHGRIGYSDADIESNPELAKRLGVTSERVEVPR